MSKRIFIKLTRAGKTVGPFNVLDQNGYSLFSNISKSSLIVGASFVVEDYVLSITLKSQSSCTVEKTQRLQSINSQDFNAIEFVETTKSSLWAHLVDKTLYNSFYTNTEPYVIEYPFNYNNKDEIIQSVSEYNKVYKYLSNDINSRIEANDCWFNKAILYNDIQSSGTLTLEPNPIGNMQEYLRFPKFNDKSKSIIWTKLDNMYQYNTFWSLVKDRSAPLFNSTCESLSIDKVLNQNNMDYSVRAYRKETIRGKDLKVRHILDNKSDVKIVTQFILTPSMISHV